MDLAVHALVGLLPVCCFLAALVFLDSYKLVSLRWILVVIGIGFAAAVASYPLNVGARALFDIDFVTLTRYVAPFIEETLKALVIVALIQRNRIGFLALAPALPSSKTCSTCKAFPARTSEPGSYEASALPSCTAARRRYSASWRTRS
jgi:hypothetical protein